MGQSYVLKLKELCDGLGIRLTLSVHPWHHQITRGEVSDEYVQIWESFARDQEIPFISFYPLFINDENPERVIQKYYIQNDNHWNEFGHERVAGYLKEYFLSHNPKE